MKNLALYTLLLIAQTGLFGQTDKSGCRDHPLITRYPGSLIEYCDTKNYSEFAIATGPETGYRNIDDWQNVTGKHTRIYYSIAGDRTITEIYHNYLSALNKEGFSLLANKQHGERNISKEVGGNTWLGTFYRANPYPTNVGIKMGLGSGTMGGTFYAAAHKDNVYVVVAGKRYNDNETVVLLDVIETTKLEDDLITIDADFIGNKLFNEGRVALQGILFDHNQASIKNESLPILLEIAQFLKQNPRVVIFVVGHTDMTGEVQYNIDLSSRRARAVVEHLVNDHKINEGRLLSYGVGPLAPTASNKSDEGRKLNRRVELVLKSD